MKEKKISKKGIALMLTIATKTQMESVSRVEAQMKLPIPTDIDKTNL